MSENLNLKTITTVDPSPFKHLCVTIGELPSTFVESMSYYECLAWLVSYLENTVIPAVNQNGEATAELQEKFTELNAAFDELQSYVEHYFDNLDVQEEINNKLDAMVENGTFTELITPIVGDQIDQLSSEVTTALADFNKTLGDAKMKENRKKYYMGYSLVTKPTEYTEDFFKNINIYTNEKGNYFVNYNKEDFINQNSTNTWYFSPSGDNANSGEDAEHPLKLINATVLANMTDGDTVILASGYYPRGCVFGATIINKSLNFICPDGEATITLYDEGLEWTQSGNNSWTTSRSGIVSLFDISKWKDGQISELTKLTSSSDVDTTPNSYYVSGSTVYVHMYDNKKPSIETLGVELSVSYSRCEINAAANNMKIYMNNINFIGCHIGGIVAKAGEYTGCKILLDNVNIYLNDASGYNYDSFTNQGFMSICDHVKCYASLKDSFNYHQTSDLVQAYGLEINCVSNDCGRGRTASAQLSNNATTAHNECKVIRVNGNYTLCNGGTAVDINNAVGAFYNCIIGDSYGRNYDVYATDDAKIYMYDCYLKGSTAQYNLRTSENGVIYVSNCEYDTSNGNIVDLNA